MNESELRFTDTNSADDSKGRTWGLDGNLFWYLAGGAFVSVVLLLLLFSVYRLSFAAAGFIAGIPLLLALVYVFGFRQGKPPGYDVDCLEYWIGGKGFGPDLRPQLRHPLKQHHVH
jgi:hypothetical protein